MSTCVRFKELYVLPYSKTLKCVAFKNIFDDKCFDDNEIEVKNNNIS